MAEHRLPALLVLDGDGAPRAILPASQMIKAVVPAYVMEDPTLAAVVDEGPRRPARPGVEGPHGA